MNRPTLRSLAAEGPVHFMGVAGAGMWALAEALLRSGGRVTGCDLDPGGATRSLEELGARVHKGHDPVHVEGASALVVTSAVPSDHPELRAARARSIPILKRAEALGDWVSAGYVLAVSGTHGKTTTSAMLTEILAAAGREPTAFVGGRVRSWGGNFRPGSDEVYVVEADEFDRSFHALTPDLAVVTNVEADHLDVYGSLEGVREAFRTFLERVPGEGAVVACGDDPEVARLLPGLPSRVETYGLSPGTILRGVDVRLEEDGSRVGVIEEGEERGKLRVGVPGLHNVLNALGASGAARLLGTPWDAIRAALEGFRGVGRRFEHVGDRGGITVVDDYAHHPSEIRASLAAARVAFPGRRLVAVFQPHLFTRTRDFLDDFGVALAAADAVWVTGVYPAREEPIPGIGGQSVAEAVRSRGLEAVHFHEDLASLPEVLGSFLESDDVCLTLGAGSIEHLGPRLLEVLDVREGKSA